MAKSQSNRTAKETAPSTNTSAAAVPAVTTTTSSDALTCATMCIFERWPDKLTSMSVCLVYSFSFFFAHTNTHTHKHIHLWCIVKIRDLLSRCCCYSCCDSSERDTTQCNLNRVVSFNIRLSFRLSKMHDMREEKKIPCRIKYVESVFFSSCSFFLFSFSMFLFFSSLYRMLLLCMGFRSLSFVCSFSRHSPQTIFTLASSFGVSKSMFFCLHPSASLSLQCLLISFVQFLNEKKNQFMVAH